MKVFQLKCYSNVKFEMSICKKGKGGTYVRKKREKLEKNRGKREYYNYRGYNKLKNMYQRQREVSLCLFKLCFCLLRIISEIYLLL